MSQRKVRTKTFVLRRSFDLAIDFPLSRKSRKTIIKQLWIFLDHAVNLRSEFLSATFRKGTISLEGNGYTFHISSEPKFHITIWVLRPDKLVRLASKYSQLIFGFLNTLGMNELLSHDITGSFTSDRRQVVPAHAVGMFSRQRVVQVSSRLRIPLKPAGVALAFKWKGYDWLALVLTLGKGSLGLYYHAEQKATIPSDLVDNVFNYCVSLAKRIKSSLKATPEI